MGCKAVAIWSMLLSERPRRLSHSTVLASSPPLLWRRGKAWFGATQIRCSHGIAPSAASPQDEQGPPQEAVLKAISEVSKAEGRVTQTTNVVIGGTVVNDSTDEWLVLDKKVNSYPMARHFTAIGIGGDEFVQAMVVAVESVIQESIPKESHYLPSRYLINFDQQGRVTRKVSSRGKYVSVNIGPIHVVSSEQVQAVYNAMKSDDRTKYFL